jgi:flagellar hook-length control protein FliK
VRDAIHNAEFKSTSRPGERTIEVQLDPPDLGQLRIVLTETDHGVTAKIVASKESALTLLRHEMPQIQQVLADSGVQMDGFSFEQSDSQRHPYRDREPGVDYRYHNGEIPRTNLSHDSGPPSRRSSLVDVYA